MDDPRFAIRLKTLNRYHYRGTLYERTNPHTREAIEHAVTRELRNHLVGTGKFEDVRAEEPEPVEPTPVPEPEALSEEGVAAAEQSQANPNDMSRESMGITKQYGQKADGIEV